MRRNNLTFSCILFALLFSACVWEDMANCNVSLHIKYDYNEDGRDKILEEVDHLDLFIFSEDGRLYKRLSIHPKIDGTSITLPIEGGTYHLMAWGNVPPPTHQDVSYQYDTDSNKLIYQSDKLEFQDSVRGLFYGITESFTIDGDRRSSREMSLVKNTKQIDVVIIGATDTECEIFANNRNHDNENTPFDRLDSAPKKEKEEEGSIIYRFNTHRLLLVDSLKSSFKFTGKQEGTGEQISIDESLITLLLKHPDIKDLDRFDYYRIELICVKNYLRPIIKVNGYTVVDLPGDL